MEKALYTESMADYAYQQLKQLEENLGTDLWVERTPLSLTIRFKQTNLDLIFKYSLSSETLYVKGEKRAYNHIFIMEHVTTDLLDRLIADLSQPDAFPPQPVNIATSPDRGIITTAKDLIHFPHTGRGFR
jgi:histidine decarboxylase